MTFERIAVLGCGGSGKSTLSRRLKERTGLPVVHLDRHYWNAGWTPTPDGDWEAVHADLVRRPRWIIDGNFSRTMAPRLARADAAIFLDLPTWRCVLRILRRIRTWRGRTRPDLPDGCPERFDWEFLWWVAGFRRRSRARVLHHLAREKAHRGLLVVRLRNPREVRAFLDRVARR